MRRRWYRRCELETCGYSTTMTSTTLSIATGSQRIDKLRTTARFGLSVVLIVAGTSHLTWARRTFQAQVPRFVPLDADGVVMASGGVEIMLGSGLAVLGKEQVRVGRIIALFFVAVFPGNVAQYVHQRDGFGLNTNRRRLVRLLFQPVLVAWALWSTGRTSKQRNS